MKEKSVIKKSQPCSVKECEKSNRCNFEGGTNPKSFREEFVSLMEQQGKYAGAKVEVKNCSFEL